MSSRFRNYIYTSSSTANGFALEDVSPNDCVVTFASTQSHNHPQHETLRQDLRQLSDPGPNQLTRPSQDISAYSNSSVVNELSKPSFFNLIKRFEEVYDLSFPSIACGHCSILILPRLVQWQPFDGSIQYGLTTVSSIALCHKTVSGQDHIAVCSGCTKERRVPPSAGPWPKLLLDLPQRSRQFLSPLTLKTSLGRTQAARSGSSSYMTYRTLTGRISVSRNERAIHLYSGALGAYLQSSSNTIDQGHDLAHLDRCRTWLLANNPLFKRYDVRTELQLLPLPLVDLETGNDIALQDRPQARPDVVMNPYDYPPETRNEHFRSHRLPVADLTDEHGINISIVRGDNILEPLLFPVLYPHGRGQWIKDCPSKRILGKNTMRQDAVLKLNSVVSYYRSDHYWPAWVYMEIEARRIFQNNQRLIKAHDLRSRNGVLPLTELLQQSSYGDWSIINEKLTTTIPQFIRNGETFFVNAEARVKAMLKAKGLPTLFVTLTFSEKWDQYMNMIRHSDNPDHIPANRPWEGVQYYYERLYWLKREFLRKPQHSGFGKLLEMVERQEFQLRGAIHSHCLLWTESAKNELIEYNFIRADVPSSELEPELHALVLKHQIHTCHPELCGGPMPEQMMCRKGFPAPISSATVVTDGALRYLYKRLREEDRWVVPYNAKLLHIWKAHCNVQFVTTGGLAKYITKYVTKAEPKSVGRVYSKDHLTSYLECRRIGSMEMMVLILGFPILKMTSGCVYLPTTVPEERSLAVKPSWIIEQDPDNPYYDDALEKYYTRPRTEQFENITYFEYHSLYSIQKRNTGRSGITDEKGNFVYPRRKAQLTRFAHRRLSDGESYFFQKLLENKSWRSDAEMLQNAETYRAKFLALFPLQYGEQLLAQHNAVHHHRLCMSNLYQDLVETLASTAPVSIGEIIRVQLLQMGKMHVNAPAVDEALHLQDDQYTAYNQITATIRNSRHTGLNYFVTGPAGTGKSYLLKALQRFFESHRMPILLTAPTGIAANNIGGQTLHSALGIKPGQTDGRYQSSVFSWDDEKKGELQKVRVLVIDEVSMVNAELFMFVSSIFGRLHQNNRPFGNIHLICFGDLMQLPPVSGLKVFRAPSWKLLHPVFLEQPRRQANDVSFYTFLNKVRFGVLDQEVYDKLSNSALQYHPASNTYQSTRLVSYCRTADELNTLVLSSLPHSDRYSHVAVDREEGRILEETHTHRVFKRGTNFPRVITYTQGAKVMFLTNGLLRYDISNGTCGVVVEIGPNGMPRVAFPVAEGIRIVDVDVDTSYFTVNGISYSRQQLPLQNAYALTVHKTQGLSLPAITVSLDDTFFSPGQAYTALSRARCWADVSIAAWTPAAFKIDREAVNEYDRLKERAILLRST